MHNLDMEMTLEQQMIERAAKKRTPLSGSLELLPLCNMNCDMCYVRLSREEMERQGRLRTADEWLALAREMKEAGVLFLLLTGGEPLIFPEFRRLYLELLAMGMIVTINSNGTLIDEDWAAFFGSHKPRRINITLYGAEESVYQTLCHYPGGYDRAVTGIRLLREQGVDVRVNSTVVRSNVRDRFRIPALAREYGAAFQADSYMLPAVREREMPFNEQSRLGPEEAAYVRVEMMKLRYEPKQFYAVASAMLYQATHTPEGKNEPGEMHCQAGRSAFAVTWQGEMRPCTMLTAPSFPVFDQGFAAAWEALTHGVDGIRLSARCNACTLRVVCPACAACALLETGRIDGVPEYACRYTVATLNGLAAQLRAMKQKDQSEGSKE